MNPTERAAVLRGAYNAFGTFCVTFFTSYLMNDVMDDSLLIAAIAAFGVLGFRAGGEGMFDAMRQRTGAVSPADVNGTRGGRA